MRCNISHTHCQREPLLEHFVRMKLMVESNRRRAINDKFFRPLTISGLLAISVLWLSVGWSLVVTKLDIFGKLPISYLGVFQESKTVFNFSLIVSACLLLAFCYFASQQLRLSRYFIATFILGQLAQITVAVTPFNSTSIARPVHVVAGFVLAFSLPLSMYWFMRSDIPAKLHDLTKFFLKIEIALFILGIGWFVLASSGGALAEIVTAVAFDLWIVAISLKTRNTAPHR